MMVRDSKYLLFLPDASTKKNFGIVQVVVVCPSLNFTMSEIKPTTGLS